MLQAIRIIGCTVIEERRQDGEQHSGSNVEQCEDVALVGMIAAWANGLRSPRQSVYVFETRLSKLAPK